MKSPEPGAMGLYIPKKMFAKMRQKWLKKCAQKLFGKSAPKRCKSAPKMFAKVRQKTVWQKCTKNVFKSVPKHCKSAPKMFEKVRQKNCLAKVHQKCLQKCAKKYNYEIKMKTF